jgi:hypothetical protein
MPTPQRPYTVLVLQSFEAVVNGHVNQYHAGHRYTVREGSTWDDLEKQLFEVFLPSGKVTL